MTTAQDIRDNERLARRTYSVIGLLVIGALAITLVLL